MINFLSRKNPNLNLLVITFSIIALFLHGKVPYMLFLSVSLFLFVMTHIIYENRKNSKIIVRNYITYSIKSVIYLNLVIIYLLVIIVNRPNEIILYKELIYAIYIWVIIGVLYVLFKLKPDSELLFKNYFQSGYVYLFLIVITGIIISIITKGILFREIFGLSIDYNFLAFSLLTCFIIIVHKYKNIQNKWGVLLFVIYLLILVISILISGSRRGLLFLGITNIILIVFLLKKIIHKTTHKILFGYFLVITFLIFLVSILFYSSPAAIKNYIVNKTFPLKKEQIKSQYSQILHRYSSIKSDTISYVERYNKDWISVPFERKSMIDDIMFNRVNKRFSKEYEEGAFDKAFESLIELRNFSNSVEKFSDALPYEYKKVFTKEFITSDNFLFAPYLYPIPYIERDFYSINKLENFHPLTSLKNNSQLPILFIREKLDSASLSLFISLLPNTNNKVFLFLKGFNKNELKISVLKKDNPINIDHIEIANKRDDGFSLVSLQFKVLDINKGIGKLIIQPNSNLNDTFCLGKHWHERSPINLKYIAKNNLKTVKTIQRILSEKITSHNNYYQRYLNEFKILTKAESDSLNYFLDSIHLFQPNFKPYGRYSILVEENKFQSSGNDIFTRCFAIVPSISGIRYRVNLKVKSSKPPDIYIKRFPERTMFSLIKEVVKKEINFLGDSTYSIVYEYIIRESQSAIGALVIGERNAGGNDFFTIFDFKLSVQKKDSVLNINPFQYSVLKRFIFKDIQEGNLSRNDNKIMKYIEWKEQYSFDENKMINSRAILWKFAFTYFNDFTLKEKIFGKGFEYLKVYQYIFDEKNDKTASNYYPHNPIISSLLYSGIIGALIYVLFLVQVFYRYLKLRKKIALFGILYLLAFSFTFFSGNSHFSVPAFLILSLIPYAFDLKENDKVFS